jgi:hypothetical protein
MEQGLSERFGHLREKLARTLILIFPDWKKEFHVHVDESSIALGEVISQLGNET